MRTFHGRDIFSPVAAALAAGKPLEELGEKINPGSPVRLELPVAEIGEGLVVATVLARDRYGNLMLNLGPEEIRQSFLAPGQAVAVEAGGAGSPAASRRVAFASAFGEVEAGEGLLYPDSSGSLALAVNRGDAARTFGLEADDRVRLSPA
jgi:S-adenosylmethionine hydrolase